MFTGFEHRFLEVLKNHKQHEFKEQRLVVACSGGLDSVVLLHALLNVQPVLKYSLEVLYVHHGASKNDEKQTAYRDKAFEFVKNLSEKKSLKFHSEKSKNFLKTEEDCRNFRKQVFSKFTHVVLAHHKDDFLETLVLRLLRGAGPQGLEEPFKEENGAFIRPFLNTFHREELLLYAKEKNFEWVKDPTNEETDHLRNWIRNKWLKDLHEKIGTKGFFKSLELISEAFKSADQRPQSFVEFTSEDRGEFELQLWLEFDQFQKQSTIAHILHKVRKTGYTKGQVVEVVKQLDQQAKRVTFEASKMEWSKTETKVEFRKLLKA